MNRFAVVAMVAVMVAGCSSGKSTTRSEQPPQTHSPASTRDPCAPAKPGDAVGVETNGHPLTLDPMTVTTADGHRAHFAVRADFAGGAIDTDRYRDIVRDTTTTRVRNAHASEVREAVTLLDHVRRDACLATGGKVVAVHFVNLAVR